MSYRPSQMVDTTHIIVKSHNEGYKFLWDIEGGGIPSGGEHKHFTEYKALGIYSEGWIYSMSVLSKYPLPQSIR